MPTAIVGDVTLYYETLGTGVPLVLIAGLNSDHTLFRSFLPRLAEHQQVIVFDNRGIGRSTGAESRFTMETLADDTAGLLHALEIEQAHVIGVSLGGRIALSLALRHPEAVRSLILVSTSAAPPPHTWHRRWVGFLLHLPFIRRGNPHTVVARQRRLTRAFDCTDRLPDIHVPTLILQGQADKTAPFPLAERMHERIAGSRIMSFGGGHIFFILRAKEFVDAVLAFMDRVDR